MKFDINIEAVEITRELIRENHNDPKIESYIEDEYEFLKSIQEDILDIYLDKDTYLKILLSNYEEIFGTMDIGDNQGLTQTVYTYRNSLNNKLHVKRITDAYDDMLLSEQIELLYLCYNIKTTTIDG